MKLLYIVNDANVGGAQTLIEQLGGVGADFDWECHLLVLQGRGELSGRLETAMTSVRYLGLSPKTYRLDRLLRGVKEVVRGLQPDVLHSHLLQSDLAAMFIRMTTGVPVVSTVHTTGMNSNDPMRSRVLGRAVGFISRYGVDMTVACGERARAYMERMHYRGNRTTISNGVSIPDPADIKPGPRHARFLSLARFHPMKDHANFLQAFAVVVSNIPEAYAYMAGSGVDEQNRELVAMLKELNIRDSVSLLGAVEDVSGLLYACDALVISSAYGEALPMVGLEALSFGVPVISTDVGDCHRITADPRLLVPPKDSKALSDAMLVLAGLDQEPYERLAELSLDIAIAKFSIQETAKQYDSVYRKFSK